MNYLYGDVHLLLRKNDDILLIKRQKTGFMDGYFSLPAGRKEKNEEASKAIIREASEEIGIHIDTADLNLVHIMHHYSQQSDTERVEFFFEALNWRGDVQNCEPEKCGEVIWVPIKRLPENTIPYVVFALNETEKGNVYSEYGWSSPK